MSRAGDLSSWGAGVGQHHDQNIDWPTTRRLVVHKVRCLGQDEVTTNKQYDLLTLGYDHGGAVWYANYGAPPPLPTKPGASVQAGMAGTPSATVAKPTSGVQTAATSPSRDVPLWAQAFPARVVNSPTDNFAIYKSDVLGPNAIPALQQDPVLQDWVSDTQLISQPVATPLGQAFPDDFPGTALPMSTIDKQQMAFVPAGGVLVAVWQGGAANGKFGSRVYDVTSGGALDAQRWARVHSSWRVYLYPTAGAMGDFSAGSVAPPGGLAWQLGNDVDGQAGNGVMADLPSTSAPAVSETSTPPPPTVTPTLVGGPGGTVARASTPTSSSAGMAASTEAKPNPGAGSPQTGSVGGSVLAVATYRGTGPIDCGGPNCPHLIATNPDGVPVYSAHVSEVALYRGSTGDAPRLYDPSPWVPTQPGGPLWVETPIRNDLSSTHSWVGGTAPGMRRRQTPTFIGVPKDPSQDLVKQGFNEIGTIPNLNYGESATSAGGLAELGQKFFMGPETGAQGESGVTTGAAAPGEGGTLTDPSLGEATLQPPQVVIPGVPPAGDPKPVLPPKITGGITSPTTTSAGGGFGPIIGGPFQGQHETGLVPGLVPGFGQPGSTITIPGGGPAITPVKQTPFGIALAQGQDEATGLLYGASPVAVAFPTILGTPQALNPGLKDDARFAVGGLSPTQAEDFQNAPVSSQLVPFGDQTGFVPQTTDVSTLSNGVYESGGMAFLPGDFDLLRAMLGLDQVVPAVATASLVIGPNANLAFGTPNMAGAVPNGYTISQTAQAPNANKLTISQTDANGVAQTPPVLEVACTGASTSTLTTSGNPVVSVPSTATAGQVPTATGSGQNYTWATPSAGSSNPPLSVIGGGTTTGSSTSTNYSMHTSGGALTINMPQGSGLTGQPVYLFLTAVIGHNATLNLHAGDTFGGDVGGGTGQIVIPSSTNYSVLQVQYRSGTIWEATYLHD